MVGATPIWPISHKSRLAAVCSHGCFPLQLVEIECFVSLLEHRFRILQRSIFRPPHGKSHPYALAAQADLNRFQASQHSWQVYRVALGKQQHEFVTTQPRGYIDVTDRPTQPI